MSPIRTGDHPTERARRPPFRWRRWQPRQLAHPRPVRFLTGYLSKAMSMNIRVQPTSLTIPRSGFKPGTRRTLHQVAALMGILLAVHVASPIARSESVLRFNGATTIDKLLKPKLAEIDAKHGVKIQLVPNGAGRGLEDLVAGRADVA